MTSHRSRRRWLRVGSFLVVLGVALAMGTSTFEARMAVLGADAVDVEGESFAVDGDGDAVLVVALAVRNPTPRGITVVSAELSASAGGSRLARTATAPVDERVTVPPGETAAVTVRLALPAGRGDAARAAIRSGELTVTGALNARIVDRYVGIGMEVSAGE